MCMPRPQDEDYIDVDDEDFPFDWGDLLEEDEWYERDLENDCD